MNKLITLAALTMLPLAANADQPTKWYILNFGTGECELAAELASKQHQPALTSPANLQAFERSMGLLKQAKIYRYDDGQIKAVGITREGGTNATIWFTPSLDACEDQRQGAIEQGAIGKPGELK